MFSSTNGVVGGDVFSNTTRVEEDLDFAVSSCVVSAGEGSMCGGIAGAEMVVYSRMNRRF